ncbi:MAG: TPD domain-containing protein [Methanobacteriota archaeon]
MKLSEYQDLYQKLGTPEDIDFLAENLGYDKELLLVIYTQRIVRDTTRKFYRVKAQARRLAWMWQNGVPLVDIARKFDFPPILAALMILEQRKISRKQFWKMIGDMESIKDRRLRTELRDACRADLVYSPEGTARQYARGRWGEAKLHRWLSERELKYETEKELRAKYDKTPDILLHKPVDVNGSKKYWIESKATFGDPYEIRRHIKKQLTPYSEMFGDGVVVYWFGFVNDQTYGLPVGVDILDATFFEPTPVPYEYVPVHDTPVDGGPDPGRSRESREPPRRAANV